ncbi:hypothetical protein M405DRAFT_885953 [Rhizopogon salebrosus TDB-379]|nr:hypothetical protein M405DRAFT_885953 [Rhizopogon salebrosus TDB-379]
MALRKKPTASANNAATSGSGSSAHWTTEGTSCLTKYLIIHHAEGGDGINFKQTTFTGVADCLLEPPDSITKENYVVNNRDWLSCKNKWNSCKKKHAAIVDIKSQSGFSWDDESGANIGPADAARWTAFAKTCPDTKLFRNKGWKHFHEMDELMHSQLSRGTNAFHADQETFGSQAGQATHHQEKPLGYIVIKVIKISPYYRVHNLRGEGEPKEMLRREPEGGGQKCEND